ncbi:MAG: anti-sigma factor antagonist [Planctomycetaceae bacterium]|nr:MAG: anti-sigma factor antagonist [Planctomycetaceae bacterium]
MADQQQASDSQNPETEQLIVARMFHGIVIATPEREALWDRVKIHQVHDKLVKLLAAKQPPALILDLGKVEKASSEALSILLRIRDHAVARNLQLRLCNLQYAVREVMRITELTRLFDIYETLPEAYRGLLQED